MKDSTGAVLTPYPTPEWKTPSLSSVYALSKYDQERLCLLIGKAYNIPTVALRFFNVFGTRQSLSNPYTGVLAIFASRMLNKNPVLIFEDGNQKRDFVSVLDIAQASRLALETPEADNEVFNVGSGHAYTINEIATQLSQILNKEHIVPEVCGKYRVGDIRHCFADISKAKAVLGYTPRISLEQGLVEIAEWLEGQTAEDKVTEARNELAARGLTV
jgi:dTDP-L-rhamnose 4-epimerase